MTTTTKTPEVQYLQSLNAVRERCTSVFALAEQDALEFWDVDLSAEAGIVDFCCSLIARDYGTAYDSIPPHGRWRHFVSPGNDRVQSYLDAWTQQGTEPIEVARRLVDLFVVSVLLDAGAGPDWKYTEKRQDGTAKGEPIGRSEGLAVASLDMVASGMFSGTSDKFRVDAKGLSQTSVAAIAAAMQADPSTNPMVGIEGRAQLLVNLGKVLSDPANAANFGGRDGANADAGSARPGNMVDYLRAHPSAQQTPSPSSLPISVPLEALWEVIVQGLGGVWPPSRTKLDGTALGDVWACDSLRKTVEKDSEGLVAFHKLSQWMNYSLMEIFDKILGWKFTNTQFTTGLPEYRNGGLLIDSGLLTIRPAAILASMGLPADKTTDPLALPPMPASHSAVVEFRAVTVIMLDRIAAGINKKLGVELTLAQVLESATWKGGRELAKKKRADGGPPINVLLDGTVF